MNPKPGGTVNPTKSTTSKSTTSTKTSTTTTGELASGSSQPRTDNNTKPGARKRRQGQLAQELQSSLSPPRKSRRRAESPGPIGQTNTASKSRIGGFFSHLASRIRGTRSMEEATLAKRKGKKNRPIDGETSDDEVDNRKRRKSEPDERAGGLAGQEANEKDQPAAEECDSTEAAATDSPQSAPVSPSRPACKRRVSVEAGNPIAEEAAEELGGVCKEIIEQLTQTIEAGEVPSEPPSEPGAGDNREPGTEGFISAGKRESSASGIIAAGKRKYAALKADLASKSARSALRLQSEADKVPRLAAGRWRRDEAERLRGTIQWLEDGATRLREELARARSELHEERRAAKILRKEFESALRKMREAEAAKWSKQIAELRSKIITSPSRTPAENQTSQTKLNQMKDDNHKREILVLKNRLAEAEATVQRLKSDGLVKNKKRPREEEKVTNFELQKLGVEVQSLRAANKQLEEKLQKAEESIKARANELREEHKNHETQMKALKRGLRADTIILIDEIQSKNREIDRLEKLVSQMVQTNDKLRIREEETMRKLRESEKTHQTRLAPKLEEKIRREDDTHEVDQCKVECEEEEEEEVEPTEIDRLRELAIEQQEVIEALRQAVKEKERKLDQLTKKRHKEEYYKQWYNLEPVAEVEDEEEEESEAGDSALSSAPSSLSPQPNAGCGRGGCSAGQNGVARETYESALFELEELQTKLLEEQSELGHARDQVRELEKALLQETRGSQSSRLALNEKLRLAGEREASLLAEISELREQNELLEFRVLELEESPNSRDTPDPADSGIVSPEPIHLYKEQQSNKHRDRAVATVIPYTPTYSSQSSVLSSDTQKSPLSLQESGIFEAEEEEEGPEYEQPEAKEEPRCQSTQTEAPSGELLQEVQRLQELRARIQERGAKLPGQLSPVGERKGCSCEASSLRDCVRELEARLGSLDAERQLSKQREEELLDENYRLTERLYCLEAEIKSLETGKPSVDVGVGTDAPPQSKDACQQCDQQPDELDGGDKECTKCGELWQGCQTRIEELGRTESGLRQQIAGLEQREAAFFETLRQADATWAKLEADYETKQREMSERLEAQLEINRSLFEQLGRMSKAEEKLDGKPDVECKCQMAEQSISRLAATTGVVVRADPARVATISRTNIKMPMIGCDIDDQLRDLPSPPTEMATEAKEGDPSLRLATSIDIPGVEPSHPETKQELQEALVSISKSPDDKKQIIYFRWR